MDASYALISGLVLSCGLLPAPMILAAIMKKEHVESDSTMPKIIGVVLMLVAGYCFFALGYGIHGTTKDTEEIKLATFIFSRFLFFGGAIVCLMIAGVSFALLTGKSALVKIASGLEWPGFLAGLLAAQAVVFFQQCNMQGVFKQT
ncbi:MAG TPA: hypothetical protein PKN33_12460 [Phycisphaerae bacterium]|nr:hypothetical protein [Phycisphaerales bacterium]HNO78863.1 hypothetical protein [Phycisphaerae bacterium]